MDGEADTSPFDAHQQCDVATFWQVLAPVQSEVAEAVAADLENDPALSELIQTEGGAAAARSRSLVEQGVQDGNWQPFIERLRHLGGFYADRGVAFSDWFRLVRAYRPYALPHVLAAFGGDEERLAAAVRGMGTYFDLALRTVGQAYLDSREERIARHQQAIVELSTPVLTIRPGLLLLPIVGVVDTQRSRQLTESLLLGVRDERARVVVMDITGVAEVDTEVANRLVQAAEAARLMGATPILTGISPGVAQTMVALGVDLKGLATLGDLQGGMEHAQRILNDDLVWAPPVGAV